MPAEQQSGAVSSPPVSPQPAAWPPSGQGPQPAAAGQGMEQGRLPGAGASEMSSALPSDDGATSIATLTSSETAHWSKP